MSNDGDTPLVPRNFRVRVGLRGPRGGRGGDRELAFSQVVFPSFRLDDRRPEHGPEPPDPSIGRSLVLRRGHTGTSELYELWRAERDHKRNQVREVTVMLLDHEFRIVTAWHFTGCRIVSLDYSPLDALDPDVLMESLAVSFEHFEQTDAHR